MLIESADPLGALELTGRLRRAGFAVAVCDGPRRDERCPLVAGDDCCAAAGADVVVCTLPEREEIVAALGARFPRTPVLAGAEAGSEELVLRIREALAGADRTPA